MLHATAEPLGDERWRVRLAVANAGYLPSHITKRAVERKTSRPCVFELDLPETATLEMGTRRLEGPHLDGHAAKQSLQAFLPSKELTADRAQAEWIVKAPVGTVLQLSAHAGRAGRVRASVTLG
ncbi:hypothetical protein [Ideonella paludis]|uniref:hypothetical protein n=1 Tax=Ideonella paludis TaxID=1233411 RepID=UPI0036428D31